MMYKPLLFILILSTLCLSAAAQESAGNCTPASGTPIRLGAVFPPDTLFSVEATDPYRGMAAMVSVVNECGGINGRPVEIVHVSAANRQEAQQAVEQLIGEVPLVIGSGSKAVSEVLLNASADGAFVYWEVSEPLEETHRWAFSPRPNGYQLGAQAAAFIETETSALLNGAAPRVALIHEKRPLAQAVANGVADTLAAPPIITQGFQNQLSSGYEVAVNIREDDVNVVIMAAFESDVDHFWYDMREADANVAAWIHIGEDSFQRDMCARFGNTDAMISISAAGQVNDDYRRNIELSYESYLSVYQTLFDRTPSARANLVASGVYLLLHQILPNVESETFTEENIRAAILTIDVNAPAGLMGEGLRFEPDAGTNLSAVALVQQRQDNQFCTLYPAAVATCINSLLPFPTWRERAVVSKKQSGC